MSELWLPSGHFCYLDTLFCPIDSWSYQLSCSGADTWQRQGAAVRYSSFCLQLPHPRDRSACRISGELYVMPLQWQWWNTPLTCGFHVNNSSLLPREITMPLVNTLFLLVLPSFQFVLYSSLQRLFCRFHSPRKPFLCLSMYLCWFLRLSPRAESSQEPLHGHCHAVRGSLQTLLLESSHVSTGKWEGEVNPQHWLVFVPFYMVLVPVWQTALFHKRVRLSV